MHLFILEIGNDDLDAQSTEVEFEGSIQEFKESCEQEINESEFLTLIGSAFTYGNNGILIEYYSKRMEKTIKRYIIIRI